MIGARLCGKNENHFGNDLIDRTVGIGELSKGWSKSWLRYSQLQFGYMFSPQKTKKPPDCVPSVSQDLFLFWSVFPFS